MSGIFPLASLYRCSASVNGRSTGLDLDEFGGAVGIRSSTRSTPGAPIRDGAVEGGEGWTVESAELITGVALAGDELEEPSDVAGASGLD